MINLSAGERDAIEDMDVDALRIAIEEARKAHSSTAVTRLQLYRLGAYVQEAERRLDRRISRPGLPAGPHASTVRSPPVSWCHSWTQGAMARGSERKPHPR